MCIVALTLFCENGDCHRRHLQIAAEGRERYQNTLVGRLAEYMRDVGEPVSLLQCTEALRDVFPELKKPDGTRYKGSLERAIHGALWSTGVFRKNEVRPSVVPSLPWVCSCLFAAL
jgi:hypothetical protein